MAGMVCLILFDNDHLSHADHRILVSFILLLLLFIILFLFLLFWIVVMVTVVVDTYCATHDGYICCFVADSCDSCCLFL